MSGEYYCRETMPPPGEKHLCRNENRGTHPPFYRQKGLAAQTAAFSVANNKPKHNQVRQA